MLCLCNIGMIWWLQMANGKDVKRSEKAFGSYTFLQRESQSFVSYFLEISACIVNFQFCRTLQNTALSIRWTHVFSDCFWSFQCTQECCFMFRNFLSLFWFFWPRQNVDPSPRWFSGSHKPQEHCHMLCSPQTALEEAVICTPVIFNILSGFHHTVTIAVDMTNWETTLHKAVLDCNCFEEHCGRHIQFHLYSISQQSPIYNRCSL